MSKTMTIVLTSGLILTVAAAASGEPFRLLTGVDAGLTPGAPRAVWPVIGPIPGTFTDGDRLAGTAGTASATWQGNNPGGLFFTPNQFGSLSFMFRRGSYNLGGPNQLPLLAIEYLGGPLLDLDGDLGNGARQLTPVAGTPPAVIPNSSSFLDLTFDFSGPNPSVTLNNFDATGTNSGSSNLDPSFAVTVNTIAGTQPDGSQSGPVNPGVDTRQGLLTPVAAGVTRIENLGFEAWQDSISAMSSTASTLGTLQSLGRLEGWLIERDGSGNFPTLAGLGLDTIWPQVDMSAVGGSYNRSSGGTATISNGQPPGDPFDNPGNGGLDLTAFGGDLGAYLDSVVAPLVDPLSRSFVYLQAAGFGMSNGIDPVFGATNGYDIVIIAQSAPIPEPATGVLVLLTAGLIQRRRGQNR